MGYHQKMPTWRLPGQGLLTRLRDNTLMAPRKTCIVAPNLLSYRLSLANANHRGILFAGFNIAFSPRVLTSFIATLDSFSSI